MNAFGGAYHSNTERFGNAIMNGSVRGFEINSDVPVCQLARTDVTEHNVGIGQRRFFAADLIASRTRHRPGTAGPDMQATGFVEIRDAAATGTNLGNVNCRREDALTAAADQTVA